MTLRYYAGFEEYPADTTTFPQSLPIRFRGTPDSSHTEFTGTDAEYGYGKCFHVKSSVNVLANSLLFNLGSAFGDGNKVVTGFSYKAVAFSGICSLINSDGNQILGVSVSALGYLRIYGCFDGIFFQDPQPLAQAASPLVAGQYYYLTVKWGSGGAGVGATVEVYVGNDLYVSWSGNLADPQASGHNPEPGVYWVWTDFQIGSSVGTGSNGTWEGDEAKYDNLYIVEAGGVEPIDKLGIARVGVRGPTSETSGQNVNYTRTGGTNVTDSVGTASNDGDTSYYAGADLNDAVVFDSTDTLPGTPTTIFAIMVEHYSKRTGAAGRKMKPIIRDAGANYLGAETDAPALYGAMYSIWTSRPSSGTALTKSNVDALSLGVKITN